MLKQLVPGTEDYYFYHCLHFQNTGALEKVEPLLKTWTERHGSTTRAEEIRTRQRLLNYGRAPKETLDYLKDNLSINFEHQKRLPDQAPEFPTKLDPKLIARDTFLQRARQSGDFISQIAEQGLESIAGEKMSVDERRVWLGRLKRPDLPGLAAIVIADLKAVRSNGFGSLAIHKALLKDQLDEVAQAVPAVKDNQQFIDAYLRRLQPSPDLDWRADVKEREAFLDRLWTFAGSLSPAQNSLKAHVLFARLSHDRALGKYDQARFIEYLKLPRSVFWVNPKYIEKLPARRRWSSRVTTRTTRRFSRPSTMTARSSPTTWPSC